MAAALLTVVALAALPLPAARGGQVRIDVGTAGDAFTFSPRDVRMNLGDHAVWVWVNQSHTVTSGDSSGNASPWDGLFSSGIAASGARFSWKNDRTGAILYYCVPHSPDMAARLIVSDPSVSPKVPVSDFRITEVQFNLPSGQDLIEITNHGGAAGNLGRYRLAIASTGTGVEIPLNDFTVPAGGRVVVHVFASGVNNATNLFLPTLPDLGDPNGSVALYVPNTRSTGIPSTSGLNQPSMMVDFVQWGAGGQANETTAGQANLWTPGTSINAVAAGHSIEYCPNATLDHGVQRWAEIVPNIGSVNDCSTPTLRDSWGRLKTLYRQ